MSKEKTNETKVEEPKKDHHASGFNTFILGAGTLAAAIVGGTNDAGAQVVNPVRPKKVPTDRTVTPVTDQDSIPKTTANPFGGSGTSGFITSTSNATAINSNESFGSATDVKIVSNNDVDSTLTISYKIDGKTASLTAIADPGNKNQKSFMVKEGYGGYFVKTTDETKQVKFVQLIAYEGDDGALAIKRGKSLPPMPPKLFQETYEKLMQIDAQYKLRNGGVIQH